MSMRTREHIPVAKGGIWSTTRPSVSKETQDLLKVMMKESKLTSFQQRQLSDKVKNGQPLPTTLHPTSSQNSRKIWSDDQVDVEKKVLNPRNYKGGVRSKEAIKKIVQNENEPVHNPLLNAKKITDQDKRKLQNIMAFGKDIKVPEKNEFKQPVKETEVDRFEEVLSEIEERKNFLQEMESLGRGKQFRSKIQAEISMKIRELQEIDHRRSQEVKKSFSRNQLDSQDSSSLSTD